jgi:hypothetical protein
VSTKGPAYRFPETRFTCNSPFIQLDHVRSEVKELCEAYDNESIVRVAEEALDVIHSLETFLRILEQRQQVSVSILHDLVIEKNRQRGYYV